jgi:hypothetical protein
VTIELTNSADTPEHAELRRTVRILCEQFGEKYWQQGDFNREYPEQLVDTLTKAGYCPIGNMRSFTGNPPYSVPPYSSSLRATEADTTAQRRRLKDGISSRHRARSGPNFVRLTVSAGLVHDI